MTSQTAGNPDDAKGRLIEHVDPNDPRALREAVVMLLMGQLKSADPAVDGFLGFCCDQNMSLECLWTIREADQPDPDIVAATLITPSPGNTAMLFVTPPRNSPRNSRHSRKEAAEAASQLVRTVLAKQDPQQMKVIQSLLDPNQDEVAQVLEAAGFHRLATLAYLQCQADFLTPDAVEPLPGHRVVHWAEAHRGLFEEAILASYEETLDCPGLLGLRPIEDIVKGHQATGQFNPQMWSVYLQDDGKPAAVMLLNESPHQRSMELVYLGVTRSGRRRGLGRRLVKHALVTASAHRALSLVLAVDEANLPACRLYHALGFRPTARKLAMIVSLK